MRASDIAWKSALVRGLLPLFERSLERRKGRVSAVLLLACGALLAAATAGPAGAQVDGIGDPLDSGPSFLVSRIDVRYRDPHPDQPPLPSILPLKVRLGTSASGLIAAHPDRPGTWIEVGNEAATLPYHADAIGMIAQALLTALQDRGLLGVYVQPDPADLDVEAERDLRAEGDTVLHFEIVTARVRSLRTVATGTRDLDEWRIDNEVHDRIRLRSPIQPSGADDEHSTDLVDGLLLDDYLFRLNRHPGRRVDAALAPAADGRGVSLDFLVHESKPWYAYAQVSNTGTDENAEWEQRFGFVHNQLLDRDDVLSFEYFRAGTTELNGVSVSYEAPWFDSPRPWWWGAPADGPSWLAWLDRSKLPWFGNDFLRWRVFSSYTSYSSDVQLGSLGKEEFDGEDFKIGGRLIYNAFQHRAFFVDVFGGLMGRAISIDNDAADNDASHFFLIPQGGIEIERITPVSTLFGNLTFEGAVNSSTMKSVDAGEDPSGGLEALGRAEPDDTWLVMNGDFAFSQYLEPLLNPSGWQDPATQRSSTLAHEISLGARGQWAFDNRLIPQAEQVAGGLYSVRGYEQTAAVGDNVIIGSFEYRFHLPHSLPVAREPVSLPVVGDFRVAPQQVYGRADWDFILRAFVDVAATSANGSPGGVDEPGEFLAGAGVGAELLIRSNFRARLDWATALMSNDSTTSSVEAGDHEFHMLFQILY